MRHGRYKSKLLASSLLTMYYTDEDTPSPISQCANKEEADDVLREIHERVCGNHARATSLVGKALKIGYYRPTLQKYTHNLVKACDPCQRFANIQMWPGEPMMPIIASWPFARWGINRMGPLTIGRKQFKFLIVTIDYFTKWVEAEPEVIITKAKITSFI